MNFINDIDKETLIICSSNNKKIINELNILKPIKVMTINEFIKNYYYDYDEDAIIFLMNEYKIKYEIAKEYIDNCYFVNDYKYGNLKLDYLVDIKNKLIDNKLLIYNDLFMDYLRRVKIIIYNLDLEEFYLNMFRGLDYQIINKEYHKYNHDILKFDTMEEEVLYVAEEISKLIDRGISPNKIKLTNISNDYYNMISRIFSCFNLRVNFNYESYLGSYDIVKKFINEYLHNDNIEDILKDINDGSFIYDELINTINEYSLYDNKELLIYKIEHAKVKSKEYLNGIEIIDYLDYQASDLEYIFLLSFNEGVIPKYYRDDFYITDNIKNNLGLLTSKDKNKKLDDLVLKSIYDIKNLIITYKNSDSKKSYYPSNLVSHFNVSEPISNNLLTYSILYDKIRFVKMYDEYYKYGILDDDFSLFNNNYQIKYNSYDNKFSGINSKLDKLTLSYSKLNIYNKCAFRYYLTDVLKLDNFTENFSTVIGNMVHYVMEEVLKNSDYDIDKYVNLYLKDRVLTKKEEFFLEKYQACIHELLEQVLSEYEYSSFNKAMYEEKIDIKYSSNISFTGIIDKVLYYENNGYNYLALVDYKTGADDISLAYLESGINIQLPIYLYLASKLPLKNIIFTGFYLQKFNIVKKDYRLIGYSNSDKDILSIIDNNYENSKIIKGLKTNKDGSFSRYAKLLSNDEINEIINKTEEIIKKTINKIMNSEFSINPKVIDDENIGCTFCKFSDICYKTRSDEVKIQLEEA